MSAARRRMSLLGGALFVGGLIGLGCAATQLGATPSEIAQARSQTAQGADVYANACARCHGERGEGVGSGPTVLGQGALPEYPRNSVSMSDPGLSDPQLLQIEAQSRPAGAGWRDPFRNAHDLFTFTSAHTAKLHLGALPPSDQWALVSFMLAAQGAKLPAGGANPSNASTIQIPRH
jgi:hypothetical protein